MTNNILKNKKIMHAIYLGLVCSLTYLAVYYVRNILGATTPQMLLSGFAESYIGAAGSAFFTFYAIGQLINGFIGDRIKARYMLSGGLLLAAISFFAFYRLSMSQGETAIILYGLTGFFLSMIYAPMTRVIAENTEPVYATRCVVGLTFSSFFGSPLAGVCALLMTWQLTFVCGSFALLLMALVCFFSFLAFEKKGVIRERMGEKGEKAKFDAKVLFKRNILKFTVIVALTGVVRTSVVFWMPTYISQHLDFSPEVSASIFTVATLAISATTFIAVFLYERLRRNMTLTMRILLGCAAIFFLLCFMFRNPVINILCLVLAIMSSNGADSMIWNQYCVSLSDTGMVSTATGFLDFISYMSAAVSNVFFANAVTAIGWGNLILIWLGLMLVGFFVSFKKDDIKQ